MAMEILGKLLHLYLNVPESYIHRLWTNGKKRSQGQVIVPRGE